MDFDPNNRENLSANLPFVYINNYSSNPMEISLKEASFSSQHTSFYQHLHPLEIFNINCSPYTPNPTLYPIDQPIYLDANKNTSFEYLPNFEINETKPFENHANLYGGFAPHNMNTLSHAQINGVFTPHLMDTLNRSGRGEVLENSEMVNPINMISPSTQNGNNFSFCDVGLTKSLHFNENSCKVHTMVTSGPSMATRVKGGGSEMRKKTNVVKGQWTIEEDRHLTELVERHGSKKWSFIAHLLKGRRGKQCRERWHNHLRPDIKKTMWSEEEEMIIIRAHEEMGNKWAEMAKLLPGRTENSIKNHWNATKRKQSSSRKYIPRKSSILLEYIRNLTPELIYVGSMQNPTSEDHDGFEEVPDLNYDAPIMEESSTDEDDRDANMGSFLSL